MEEHRKALSKLCFVCQTQLTKPFFSVRSVIPVDSLRLLIFPYDCNLYPNNVCQKCKGRIKKEVIKFKAFIKKKQKEGSIMTGESYIEHIGGIENLSVRSADFLPHTEGPSCFVCKSLFLNIENDGDDDFQTPLGSPVANSSPHIPMDVDNFSIITSTPVRQRSAGHSRSNNQNLDESIYNITHSEYAEDLPFDQESFMVVDHEVEESSIDQVVLDTPAYITPHKKTALKDQIPIASPADPLTLNTSKGHRTLLERFKIYMRSTKKKKIVFEVQSGECSTLTDTLFCGNKSISLNQTESPSIAENYLCCICNGISEEIPLHAACCEAIYCPDCFKNWKSKSNTCYRSCYGECDKLLTVHMGKQIEGYFLKVWTQLMTICRICGNKIKLSMASIHEFQCQIREKRPKKKKLSFDIESIGKEKNAKRKTKSTVKSVLDAAKKLKEDLFSENPELSELQILLGRRSNNVICKYFLANSE